MQPLLGLPQSPGIENNSLVKTSPRCLPGLLVIMACVSLQGAVDPPPPTPEQVEADWFLQDLKRLSPPTASISVEEDAVGAVDGEKTGKWGFHTELEEDPWWQVDLGQTQSIGRVLIYNRCDECADRNARIRLKLSDDGKAFREVYCHDGTTFYGASDNRPLQVTLHGQRARVIRLALTGKSYFHLDEVEIYAATGTTNLALGKPATQSSTSQWSTRHHGATGTHLTDYPLALVVSRGVKLAHSLQRHGVQVDADLARLRKAEADWGELPAGADDAARRAVYLRARWAVRDMALRNPLLGSGNLLFVKRAPGVFPHMSDQHYGWWSRPGGGLYVIDGFAGTNPRLHCLTAQFTTGSFQGPDVSFDGKRIVFAYCRFHPGLADEPNKADKSRVPEDAFYHVYEMNADGSGCRQLTFGRYDDFDPRYLPSGEIAFVSTRKGTAIQCSQWFSDSTRSEDHPDSYVRCGGDNYRPVPVFTLHAMTPNGSSIRPLSAFENFEWAPSVAQDGRILYTRWDYIDRFNGHFFSLWSANQDGTNPQLVYGNYTVAPQVVIEARSVPGSTKLVVTAAAHHSIYGGTLCLLDRNLGTEGTQPLARLTPEVRFPETEGNEDHYFAHPWPLSEEFFLVAWSQAPLPPHCRVETEQNPVNATGIYLLDAFGNLELLYRDPSISSVSPVPLAARPKPPTQSEVARQNGPAEGEFLLADVYRGLDQVPRGAVRRLRLIAVPPKVQPHMNNPNLGVSAEDPGKFVLGTVPVESDGSAFFRAPSGIPLFFQALDERDAALQTMRTLTYLTAGETLSCVGCHEHRDSAPPAGQAVQAALRPASRITPGPEGSWPLRFDRLVQPVLDKYCTDCHHKGAPDPEAARLELAAPTAYRTLMGFGDLGKQAFERDRSVPNQGVAANSSLWRLLTQPGGHKGIILEQENLSRLATWLDTYAQWQGHFSQQQERELFALRKSLDGTLLEVPRGNAKPESRE